MEIMGVLAELTKLSAAASASPQARIECERLAKKGERYGKSIAPVNKTNRPHRVSRGHIDEPGDYQKSIRGDVVFKGGVWRGRVGAYDFKAHWIEYGTKKMAKFAIMRRTAGYLRGSGS
ncbi:hypothetical protein AB0L97_32975 [Nocardia sp. NPDC051911]|uniref:hypothetical protein n=1 Tax=Nocardia sp. NPDC051911 TaxID=3154648 RepID=UPI003425538C